MRPSSVELDGVEIVAAGGRARDLWTLHDVSGFGVGGYRSNRVEMPGRPGARAFGTDLIGVRTVTVEASIEAGSPEDAAIAEAALLYAWRPRSSDVTLTVDVAGGRRTLTGRPVSCEIVVDDVHTGTLSARCVFDGLTGVWESEDRRQVTVGISARTVGNLVAPLVAPLAVAVDVPDEVLDPAARVVNDGSAPAVWTATLTGPLRNPALVLDGRTVALVGDVADGAVVVIDASARSVTLNGARWQSAVTLLSDWWEIDPGAHDFELRAVSGLGTAVLSWADSWL